MTCARTGEIVPNAARNLHGPQRMLIRHHYKYAIILKAARFGQK